MVLWFRRATWRFPWEMATSASVACMTISMLLIPPFMAGIVGPPLYALTGLHNAEDLLGHLAYLGGLSALLQAMLSRIDLPEYRAFIRARVIMPAKASVPVIISLFIAGSPERPVADFITESGHLKDGWLLAYWQLICAAALWIIGHLVWALLIIRRESPASAVVANCYLAAIALDVACVLALSANAFWVQFPAWPGWWLLCVATAAYAAAAGLSWRARLRHFGARNSGFTVVPARLACEGYGSTAWWWWLVLGHRGHRDRTARRRLRAE